MGGLHRHDLLKRGVKTNRPGMALRPSPPVRSSTMIPRYTRPEMASIWEPQTRFKIWFEIEAHAADALAELGTIPKEAAKTVWAKAKDATFDVARIDEIERETKHDAIAFLTHLAEIVGPEARFVHQGMTSSDTLDTCFNVQPTRAADILIADVEKLLDALKRRPLEHKMTPTIGRQDGPCGRAGLHASDPARSPRDVLRDARRCRLLGRAACDRDPASAAHRGAGGGRVFLGGAEGLLRDAAQAQSGALREPHRPRA